MLHSPPHVWSLSHSFTSIRLHEFVKVSLCRQGVVRSSKWPSVYFVLVSFLLLLLLQFGFAAHFILMCIRIENPNNRCVAVVAVTESKAIKKKTKTFFYKGRRYCVATDDLYQQTQLKITTVQQNLCNCKAKRITACAHTHTQKDIHIRNEWMTLSKAASGI